MELRAYVFLLFGSMLIFYLLGYTAPVIYLLSNMGGESTAWEFVINQMLKIFTDPTFLTIIGVSAVATILTSGNYSVMFVFPIMLLYIIANVFFLPTSFILESQIPLEIKTIFLAYFNLLLYLGAIQFVRGGSL